MKRLIHKMQARRAFTLLELLMVIAIIGILMSMSVVVMLGFKDSAEEEATSATVQKLARLVEQRVEAFDRAFKGTRRQQAMIAMQNLLIDPNQDNNRSDGVFGVYESAVEILAKKSLFRFEFPQSFADRLMLGDAGTIVTGLPDSIYIAILAPTIRTELGLPVTTALTDAAIVAEATTRFARHQAETESAECLYFQLFASGNYGASAVDGDRFTEREIQDTDGDGLPELIDAWGNPLRFYRWPTRMIDVDPPVPFQPVLSDPNDATDVIVTLDTNNDGTPDTTIGQRRVTPDERAVANIMMRGLPPAPSLLPNGALPRDLLLTDPDDPVGILYSELERLNGSGSTNAFATVFNETDFHTPDTFHAPMVVSAGIDEELGLYEPWDETNFGNLAAYNSNLDTGNGPGQPSDFQAMLALIQDNITSRNKVAGGKLSSGGGK
jgi:prepilin-type N-terminal cleavage/methylation domain-containing protein